MGSRFRAERVLPVLIAFGLVLAACTSAPTEPVEVEDCDGLVGVGVELVEGYLELVERLDMDVVLYDAPVPDELAADLADLDRRSSELDTRIVELACDTTALRSGIVSRVEGLDSEEFAGQILLELVRDG